LEFLFEELTDEDGKIAIEFLRKRQKPGPGKDPPGCIVTDKPARRRAVGRTERVGAGAPLTSRRDAAWRGIRATSACFEAVGGRKFARPPALLKTRHVDKLRSHRHVLMTCRRHRHFRRSFSVGKEASEPLRPDRPKRSRDKNHPQSLRRRVRPRQNSSSPESTSSAAILVSQTSSRYMYSSRCSMVQEDVDRCRRFCPLLTPLMGRPFRLSSWRRRFPILPAQSLSILQHFPSFPRSTRAFRSRSWTKCTLIRWPPPIGHGSSRHLLAIPSLWRGRRSWSNTRSADGATCLNRLAASSNKQTPNLL